MKSFIAALGLCAFSLPALAADDGDAQELSALREEVTALRSNMMSLNVKLADMQAMLRTMNTTLQEMHANQQKAVPAMHPLGGDTQDECKAKLETLTTKRDKLYSLGYKPEHPDLRTINGSIKKLEAMCGPKPEAKEE